MHVANCALCKLHARLFPPLLSLPATQVRTQLVASQHLHCFMLRTFPLSPSQVQCSFHSACLSSPLLFHAGTDAAGGAGGRDVRRGHPGLLRGPGALRGPCLPLPGPGACTPQYGPRRGRILRDLRLPQSCPPQGGRLCGAPRAGGERGARQRGGPGRERGQAERAGHHCACCKAATGVWCKAEREWGEGAEGGMWRGPPKRVREWWNGRREGCR